MPNPEDIKKLSTEQANELAEALRSRIIETVSKNGGHLSSNLGAVDLTIALLRAFDVPRDSIIFDVGHQCYAYKLLTGRSDRFDTLRQYGGISGFPCRDESDFDAFTTGHASNAISLSLGLMRAKMLEHKEGRVITVLGDGALTGGMCYEALNDAGSGKVPLIVVLNDNGMSISGNVGALSKYLTYMRLSKGWITAKKSFSRLIRRIPLAGAKLHSFFEHTKDHIRNIFIHDKFFSSLGFRYLGPIDGHSIASMERVFRKAAQLSEPVLIHVATRKGQGYEPAENSPDLFHGAAPFCMESGEFVDRSPSRAFGVAACEALISEQETRRNICVITAAMTDGTGMGSFAHAYPERYFDVGIAEEHAVSMAAGLARGGEKPVVAIYDTFLQRAYDQILMDTALQGLPVTFLIDRAGINGADGASHHGIFGLSYLRTVPELQLFCPVNEAQLLHALKHALSSRTPSAVRYPRTMPEALHDIPCPEEDGQGLLTVLSGQDASVLAVGVIMEEALKAAALLKKEGISISVYQALNVFPLSEEHLKHLPDCPLFTLEENVMQGGFGEYVTALLARRSGRHPMEIFALPDKFPAHGDRQSLLAEAGLDAKSLAKRIKSNLEQNGRRP